MNNNNIPVGSIRFNDGVWRTLPSIESFPPLDYKSYACISFKYEAPSTKIFYNTIVEEITKEYPLSVYIGNLLKIFDNCSITNIYEWKEYNKL